MTQYRGFKSNRLISSDENVISDFKEEIQDILKESNNTVDLDQRFQEIYYNRDFNTLKSDELDTTEQQIKKILKYIINVTLNKIKGRIFSEFNSIKKEIDRYINNSENLGIVKNAINELTENIKKI